MKRPSLNKYFGDRAFYRMVLHVTVPIIIQNAFTNFASLLDNIMVGQLGTEPMSGVAIVNQLMFVFNLCVFGALSGAGIFTAQYYGSKNEEGVRHTFRYKLLLGSGITVGALILFLLRGDALISSYLQSDSNAGELAAALGYGREYLRILLVSLPFFTVSNLYASTLRECGQTVAPMRSGIVGVLVNLVFNWLLIYGHFGFPKLGVTGAAVATVLSRVVEAASIVIWAHRKRERAPYLAGVYRTLRVPLQQAQKYAVKGFPLLMNEALWSSGMALLMQCYSVRGLDVVAGMNISNTVCNLFNVVAFSLGSTVSIVVGQQLGSGDLAKAKQTDTRMIVFSTCCGAVVGLVVFAGSSLFPQLYNVSAESRLLAEEFIRVYALYMPVIAFLNASYFTLRTGGKTGITFFFDCGFTWCVNLPIAFVLSRFTALPALTMYFLVEGSNLLKCVIGYLLVHKNVWLNNIVASVSGDAAQG